MCYMVVTEICTSTSMHKQGWSYKQWYAGSLNMTKEALRLLIFATMPTIWILGESLWDEARKLQKSDPDKKNIIVPMVAES